MMTTTANEHTRYRLPLLTGAVLVSLSGCGGGDGGAPKPDGDTYDNKQPGRFLNVQGLPFQSGTISGITGSGGEFQYEQKEFVCHTDADRNTCRNSLSVEPVTFHLMSDVVMGSATALATDGSHADTLTAITGQQYELIYNIAFMGPRSLSNDPIVEHNIGLVLEMVDADGDATNGIQIPTAVSTGTLGSNVNWASTNARVELAPLRDRVRQLDPSNAHDWPTDDDATTAHFASVWNCAMTGRWTAHIDTAHFTDTDGFNAQFKGDVYGAVVTNGIAAGKTHFDSAPWQFRPAFFRFSGALDAESNATLNSVQYVDEGEFAPAVGAPQMTLASSVALDGVRPAFQWSGIGYSGVGSKARRYDVAANSEKGDEKTAQPLNAIYRFAVYPLWLPRAATYDTTITDWVQENYIEFDITDSGALYASLKIFDDPTPDYAPDIGQLSADGEFTVKDFDGQKLIWQVNGHIDRAKGLLTAKFTGHDGTEVEWNIVGCTTRGTLAPVTSTPTS